MLIKSGDIQDMMYEGRRQKIPGSSEAQALPKLYGKLKSRGPGIFAADLRMRN
jgi:hypothetical protein